MRRLGGFGYCVAAGVLISAPMADVADAGGPAVGFVIEGRDTADGSPILIVVGTSLSKIRQFTISDASGVRQEGLVRKVSSKLLVLELPDATSLPGGAYKLALADRKGNPLDERDVRITFGAPPDNSLVVQQLSGGLKAALDDSETLQGHDSAFFQDASNLGAGVLSTDRYSAIADLVAEARVGAAAGQVAAGDHNHDAVYAQKVDLGAAGTLNVATNPLDWTKLKNVPAGFADGIDDASLPGDGLQVAGNTLSIAWLGLGGDFGTALSAARGDHIHDARYFTQSQLSTAGAINAAANPIAWTRLKGVPSGFEDGADNDTTYSTTGTSSGLLLTGTAFSVNFGGNGIAATLSRSDHGHDGTYARLNGSTFTGAVSVSIAGNSESDAAITGTNTSNGIGVRGQTTSTTTTNPTYGLWGSAASTNGRGVYAEATRSGAGVRNYGVYSKVAGDAGIGVFVDAMREPVQTFHPQSTTTYGVYALTTGASSETIHAENRQLTGTTYGLFALSMADAGYGVFARGATGVRGEARESDSFGVYGNGSLNGVNSTGVYGVTSAGPGASAAIQRAGVVGEHIGGSGAGHGVRGKSDSSQGTGVFGESSGVAGVHGMCTNTGGAGVFAENTQNTSSAVGLLVALTGGAPTGDLAVFKTGSVTKAIIDAAGQGFFEGGIDVDKSASATNIAVFRSGGTTKARIDSTGKGIFETGTQVGGADFAESVAVNRPVAEFEPGDVLVVDTESDRRFALSVTAESTLVSGVYSTKPGVLAMPRNPAGDDLSWVEREVPLAVTGIVPTKVCDEGGPIARGDLLVTAYVKGHAKKAPANARPGTILGKALGKLEKGRGTIEALISLQ